MFTNWNYMTDITDWNNVYVSQNLLWKSCHLILQFSLYRAQCTIKMNTSLQPITFYINRKGMFTVLKYIQFFVDIKNINAVCKFDFFLLIVILLITWTLLILLLNWHWFIWTVEIVKKPVIFMVEGHHSMKNSIKGSQH